MRWAPDLATDQRPSAVASTVTVDRNDHVAAAEVLSGTELVRDLREGLADARAGQVFSAAEVAADLAVRRAAPRMTNASPYAITFTPAARRRLGNLPLSAATALHERLTGPVAGNPRRLASR